MKTRNVVIGVAVAAVVLLAAGLLLGGWMGRGSYYGYGPGMMRDWGFGWPMMGGGLWMILLWLLVLGGLGAVVWLVASAVGRGPSNRPTDPELPLEILKRRYARGEIDREEFERIKDEITR